MKAIFHYSEGTIEEPDPFIIEIKPAPSYLEKTQHDYLTDDYDYGNGYGQFTALETNWNFPKLMKIRRNFLPKLQTIQSNQSFHDLSRLQHDMYKSIDGNDMYSLSKFTTQLYGVFVVTILLIVYDFM